MIDLIMGRIQRSMCYKFMNEKKNECMAQTQR